MGGRKKKGRGKGRKEGKEGEKISVLNNSLLATTNRTYVKK